ncbi:MAG: ribonuclease III domain-containing protein [Verrucomicrobiota bacterium]
MSRIAPPPDSPDFFPVTPTTDPTEERALAWIGDAVLGLFAREHVLKRLGRIDTPAFLDLTSNAFLSAFGRATRVEAEVGLVYQREGLAGAFSYIEARILPHWRVQEAKRIRQRKKA